MSPLRKTIYAIVTVVVGVPLLLLLVEGVLRFVGFGHDPEFYRETAHEGKPVLRENPDFTRRFFPPTLTRYPTSFRLPAVKTSGTYRIFVIGASAAQGDPEPAFSIARMLEVLLVEAFPHVAFEVVNAGITAINSHVAVSIAEDCAELQPDLFVIYLGNNEVVGPFGPGTVFRAFRTSSRSIRLQVWLAASRTGQLVGRLGLGASEPAPEEWRGIEMFTEHEIELGDARLDKTYEFFEENLIHMYEAGRGAGAHVLVGTVATNVRDFPPFASRPRSRLRADDSNHWADLFRRAEQSAAQGDHRAAAESYLAALEIDDRHAETHFRLGRIHLDAGRVELARRHLVRARDLDVLRLRADTRINEIVRSLERDDRPGLEVVDVERALGRHGGEGIIGNDLLYEHVHLNVRGTYSVAVELVRPIEQDLLRRGLVRAGPSGLPGMEVVAERLAWTLWEEYRVYQELEARMSRPPFSGQWNHDSRLAAIRQHVLALEQAMQRDGPEVLIARYELALAKRPHDWVLERNLGLLFRQLGRYDHAAQRLEAAYDAVPGDTSILYELFTLYKEAKLFEEAEQRLLELEASVPHLPRVDYHWAEIRFEQGDYEGARRYFEANLERYPGSRKTLLGLADSTRRLGRNGESIEIYRRALERFPDDAFIHNRLGRALFLDERRVESLQHLRRAVELSPGDETFRRDLAAAAAAG